MKASVGEYSGTVLSYLVQHVFGSQIHLGSVKNVGFMDLFIVVLIVPLFCPTEAPSEFTVSVEQEVYQAEENSNISMAWTFPVDTNKSPVLYVDLQNVKLSNSIYTYNSEMDAEPYLHEIYRGRLHCDPQLTMKGQFKCLLTNLRISDTGTYQCIVVLNGKSNYKPCDLNVTAATEKPAEEMPKPVSRERIGLYVSLGLFAFIIMSLALYLKLKNVENNEKHFQTNKAVSKFRGHILRRTRPP